MCPTQYSEKFDNEVILLIYITHQREVVLLLLEAGSALLVETHCQDQRLPLVQRDFEPLPRLVLDVYALGVAEEIGVVPMVSLTAVAIVSS